MMLELISGLDLKMSTLPRSARTGAACWAWTIPMDMPRHVRTPDVMKHSHRHGVSPGRRFGPVEGPMCARQPDMDVAALIEARHADSCSIAKRRYARLPGRDLRLVVRQPSRKLVMVAPSMDGVDISKTAALCGRMTGSGDSFHGHRAAGTGARPAEMERAAQDDPQTARKRVIVADAGHFVQKFGRTRRAGGTQSFGEL